jgi:hypothetical protein
MQDVPRERSLQPAVFPLHFLGEPHLAISQLVKSRLDFLFQFLDFGELDERIGFLRWMIGHIHLGSAGRYNAADNFYT